MIESSKVPQLTSIRFEKLPLIEVPIEDMETVFSMVNADGAEKIDDDVHLPFDAFLIATGGACFYVRNSGARLRAVILDPRFLHAVEGYEERYPGAVYSLVFGQDSSTGAAEFFEIVFNRAFKELGKEIIDQRDPASLTVFAGGQLAVRTLAWLIAQEDRWIVEVKPTKPPKQSSTFVPRLHERTRLLIWKKDKVNRTFREPIAAVAVAAEEPLDDPDPDFVRTLAAHRRRGHWKTLRSERFVNKRGTRVWVRATWVGPEEMIRGHETYRVRLDL